MLKKIWFVKRRELAGISWSTLVGEVFTDEDAAKCKTGYFPLLSNSYTILNPTFVPFTPIIPTSKFIKLIKFKTMFILFLMNIESGRYHDVSNFFYYPKAKF